MTVTPPGEHGTCPSASGRSAESAIIGLIGPDGRVACLPDPIPLTADIRAEAGPQPERTFRLAAPCRASACVQWNGAACGLIGAMRTALADQPASPIGRCGIRGDCVWFRQSGFDACRLCPSVTYNPSP